MSEASERTHAGGCLCGAVRFEAEAPLDPIVSCHCSICRRQTSQVLTVSGAARERFRLVEDRGLRWYASGPRTRRGFCGECGAALFFEGDEAGRISISAGAFDLALGMPTSAHIFTLDKGDWYEVPDDAPHHAGDLPFER